MIPSHDLQTALLVLITSSQGSSSRLKAPTSRLVGAPGPDRSWATASVLRVTRRDCDAPWSYLGGRELDPTSEQPATETLKLTYGRTLTGQQPLGMTSEPDECRVRVVKDTPFDHSISRPRPL